MPRRRGRQVPIDPWGPQAGRPARRAEGRRTDATRHGAPRQLTSDEPRVARAETGRATRGRVMSGARTTRAAPMSRSSRSAAPGGRRWLSPAGRAGRRYPVGRPGLASAGPGPPVAAVVVRHPVTVDS